MSSSYTPPDKILLKEQYENKIPLYRKLKNEIIYILEKIIKDNHLNISDIQKRVKKFNSFYDKVLRKELTEDYFNLINDISGIRLIFTYRSDLDKMKILIRDNLLIVKEDQHRNPAIPFGYMSDHYIVKIPDNYRGHRYNDIKELKCEIQVRTVAMHAWATVSHQLDYKQEIDIPSELKSDFIALSGVIYIADSLFEQFKNARNEKQQVLLENIKKNIFELDQEINMDTLKAFLLWKFPKREKSSDLQYSALISELKTAHFINYIYLNKIVDKNIKTILKLEDVTTSYPKSDMPTRYRDVGVIRIICRDIERCEDYPNPHRS